MFEAVNITSVQNKYIKQINLLKTKKERDKTKLFVVEGEKLIEEIPLDWETEYIVLSTSYFSSINNKKPFDKFPKSKIFTITDELFKKISDTVTPQGILAVCRQKAFNQESLFKKETPLFLLLEKVCDPGNMGTLIRTSDAAGIDGVFLSKGCVDLYNSKVIRATMGSVFHLPIIENCDFDSLTDLLKKNNINIFAAHLKGSKLPYETDLTKSCGILIGNEANGLSPDISKKATTLVKIPMPGKAESINASIAGSIFIYEAVRQRIQK